MQDSISPLTHAFFVLCYLQEPSFLRGLSAWMPTGNASTGASLRASDLFNSTVTLDWTLTDMGVDTKGIWGCYDGNDSPENPCWTPNTTNTAQNLWDSFDPAGDPYGYGGPVFAAIDISYVSIPLFFSDSRLKTMYDNWQNQGSNPPALADAQAGLVFVYTVDGTAAHSEPPSCAGAGNFKPPDGIQPFEYSFKYRLRI